MSKSKSHTLYYHLSLIFLLSIGFRSSLSAKLSHRDFLDSENFSVDSTRNSNYLIIEQSDMEQFLPSSSQAYLEKLSKKYGKDIVSIKNASTKQDPRNLDHSVNPKSRFFQRGIINVDLKFGKNYQDNISSLLVRVKDDQDRETNKPETEANTTIRVDMPTVWTQKPQLRNVIKLVGLFSQLVIMILQAFLMFVRPFACFKDTQSYHMGTAFTSSLLLLQTLVFMGSLTEAFGGVVDGGLLDALQMAGRCFVKPVENLPHQFGSEELLGTGAWNLSKAGIITSPMMQHYISIPLLLVAILLSFITHQEYFHYYSREIRMGVTLSFMVPHMVVSVNSICAFFSDFMFTPNGLFSLLVSVILVCYYSFFIFYEKQKARRVPAAFLLTKYDQLNFDSLPYIIIQDSGRFELTAAYAAAIVYGVGGYFKVFPLVIMAVLQLAVLSAAMLVKLHDVELLEERDAAYYRFFHFYKIFTFVLRPLSFGLLTGMSILRIFGVRNILVVKWMSLIFFVSYTLDFILQIVMIGYRIRNLFQFKIFHYNGHLRLMANGKYIQLKEHEAKVDTRVYDKNKKKKDQDWE